MKLRVTLIVFGLLAFAQSSHANSNGWWTAFGDSNLTAIVEYGLAVHPDLQSSLASLRAAASIQNEIRNEGRPEAVARIALRAGQERTMYTNREVGDIEPLAGSATLRWELDLFGRIKAGKRAAAAGWQVQEANQLGVRLLLSTRITQTLIELAAQQEALTLLRANREQQDQLVEHLNARRDAGLESSNPVFKAEAQQVLLVHHESEAVLAREKLLASLNALLGGHAWPRPLPALQSLQVPPAPGEVPGDQEIQRPDVLQAWWTWQQLSAREEQEARRRKPTLALMATAAGESTSNGEIEPWNAWVGPVLELPLWQPKLKAGNETQQAKAKAAEQRFRSLSLQAMRDMHIAMIDLESANDMHDHLQEHVRATQTIEAQQQRLREAGLIQRAARLRSSQASLRAQLDSVSTSAQRFTAYVNWVRASGHAE